jgi:hypothetical protein
LVNAAGPSDLPDSHDELASHDVKLVLALKLGRVGRVLSGTDSETVLVEGNLPVSVDAIAD